MTVGTPFATDELSPPRPAAAAESSETTPAFLELEGQRAAGDDRVFRNLRPGLPQELAGRRVDHVNVAKRAEGDAILDRQRNGNGNRRPPQVRKILPQRVELIDHVLVLRRRVRPAAEQQRIAPGRRGRAAGIPLELQPLVEHRGRRRVRAGQALQQLIGLDRIAADADRSIGPVGAQSLQDFSADHGIARLAKRQGRLEAPFRIARPGGIRLEQPPVPDRGESEFAAIEMEVTDRVGGLLPRLGVEVLRRDVDHLVPVAGTAAVAIELPCLGFVTQAIRLQLRGGQPTDQTIGFPGHQSGPAVGRADRGMTGMGQHDLEHVECLVPVAPFDQLLGLIEMFALRGVVRNAAIDRVARTATFGRCRIVIGHHVAHFFRRRVRPRVPVVEVPGSGPRCRPAGPGKFRGSRVLILVLRARFGRRRSIVLLGAGTAGRRLLPGQCVAGQEPQQGGEGRDPQQRVFFLHPATHPGSNAGRRQQTLTIPEIDLPDLDPIASSAPCKYIVATPGRLADKRKFGPLRPAPRRFCGRLLRILGKQMIGRRTGIRCWATGESPSPRFATDFAASLSRKRRFSRLVARFTQASGVAGRYQSFRSGTRPPYCDQPRERPRTSSRVRLAGRCAFRASG